MDPLTHGMIGLAISTFSGQAVSLTNPLALGCALSAMAPDLDAVIRLYSDDARYLKAHRGFSHSVPMLLVFSGIITLGLGLTFKVPQAGLMSLWLWSFLGALSHTVFDMLNSYGAMLIKRKRKLNLLTLYDPIIAFLGIGLILQREVNPLWNGLALGLFLVYMGFRHWHRKGAARALALRPEFEGQVLNVAVLPALTTFYRWDYIVETTRYTYVGKYNQWTRRTYVTERLDAQCPRLREAFDQTTLGMYFNDFSPHLHVVHSDNGPSVTLSVVDLRYYVKNRFLHQATVVMDKESLEVQQSILHPYGKRRSVVFYDGDLEAQAS